MTTRTTQPEVSAYLSGDVNGGSATSVKSKPSAMPGGINSAPAFTVDVTNHEPDAAVGQRAVFYLRVSSSGQVNNDYDPEGISLPAQREACKRKAQQLGLTIVGEYVEPGRSGTEMTKRVAFQQMLQRVRSEKDIDYIIVHKLSRMNRNRIDDAIVMADLHKRGVTLISATESIDDSPVGQLMHGILAAFNEYRSREDGADISYKMGQKAKNGGTLGKAPIGYLNTLERLDGREFRSIGIDAERSPFVQLAFRLYADGDHTIDNIVDELTDRGLTTRPTRSRPAGPVSASKLAAMLHDRYYLGIVTYQGQEYPGRHEPLIDENLFQRVQDLLETRGFSGERRRTHHHYLKGSLWCGRCHRSDGAVRRMILQRAVGRAKHEYFYFLCRGTQDGVCDARYSNVIGVEGKVIEHYDSIRFTPEFIDLVRSSMDETLADREGAQRLLDKQLKDQLRRLDAKEENLLDIAASGELAKTKIHNRLQDIERQRSKITQQLDGVAEDLAAGAKFIDVCLNLLQDPRKLYEGATDETRRKLNQAIFKRLYVMNDEIVGHELQEPLAELHAVQAAFIKGGQNKAEIAEQALIEHAPERSSATLKGDAARNTVHELLTGVLERDGSSKPQLVRKRGLEPLHLSVQEPKSCASANSATPASAALSIPPGRPLLDQTSSSRRNLATWPLARTLY